jgi:hypothetical protein
MHSSSAECPNQRGPYASWAPFLANVASACRLVFARWQAKSLLFYSAVKTLQVNNS